jgi:hypothetical protein
MEDVFLDWGESVIQTALSRFSSSSEINAKNTSLTPRRTGSK